MSSGKRVVLNGEPTGATFALDSRYQTSDASLVTASGSAWTVYWSRLYQLSDVEALTSMDVTVASGGELVAPARLVLRRALSVAGTLSGVERLAVGDGGALTLSASGTSG